MAEITEYLGLTLPAYNEAADIETLNENFQKIDDAYGDGMNNYTLSERVIGTWIDGRPLYQKTVVVDVSDMSYSSQYGYTIPVSDIGLADLYFVSAKYVLRYMDSGREVYLCIPYAAHDAQYIRSCDIATNDVFIFKKGNGVTLDISTAKIYVTVQYVKEVDTDD